MLFNLFCYLLHFRDSTPQLLSPISMPRIILNGDLSERKLENVTTLPTRKLAHASGRLDTGYSSLNSTDNQSHLRECTEARRKAPQMSPSPKYDLLPQRDPDLPCDSCSARDCRVVRLRYEDCSLPRWSNCAGNRCRRLRAVNNRCSRTRTGSYMEMIDQSMNEEKVQSETFREENASSMQTSPKAGSICEYSCEYHDKQTVGLAPEPEYLVWVRIQIPTGEQSNYARAHKIPQKPEYVCIIEAHPVYSIKACSVQVRISMVILNTVMKTKLFATESNQFRFIED